MTNLRRQIFLSLSGGWPSADSNEEASPRASKSCVGKAQRRGEYCPVMAYNINMRCHHYWLASLWKG